jgi:hypothetical protein
MKQSYILYTRKDENDKTIHRSSFIVHRYSRLNKTIRITIIGVFIFFASAGISAQVTIGADMNPVTGALLDFKNHAALPDSTTVESGGLVLPRVRLVSRTTLEPFIATSNPEWLPANQPQTRANHIGLTVYNLTDNAAFHAGLYTWVGGQWEALEIASSYIYLPSFNLEWVTSGTREVDLYGVYRDNFNPSSTAHYFSSQAASASTVTFPDYLSDANSFYYLVTYYDSNVITINGITVDGKMTYTNAGKGAIPPDDAFINIVLVRK